MKLHILAIGAHPDDVELGCSGTLLKHISQGKKAGILDLTRGELGTRGNADLRMKEAASSLKILGAEIRDNLGFTDGFFKVDKEHIIEIVKKIRQYRPEIVLCNAESDRHPDHGRSGELVSQACFYSGLVKINTGQEAWRPKAVYHYVQDRYRRPDVVVDISEFAEKKFEAIAAFASQFHDPSSKEPQTPISSPFFMEFIRSRMADFGRIIGVRYAEGFTAERPIGVEDLLMIR